ncbi:MAG: DUF882 domain-containing protein [bacterium]|nr:DUF882 domain-containing protein [bacterium]
MPFVNPYSFTLNDVLSRRNFLKLMLCSSLLSFFPKFTFAAIDEIALKERSLSLFNPRTKESFEGIYYCNGDYVPKAMEIINHIMRDTRTGDVKIIDKRLLDLISAISIKLKPEEPFQVISGYRSPRTNNLLRKRGKGAAKNSYHLKGQAVDIRLPGYRTSVLRKAAYKLKSGGVGYYPKSRFVHIDIGPVRYWSG